VNLRVVALDESNDPASFTSGNAELDQWLRVHACNATGQGTRTLVVIDERDTIVGYFAIAPHVLVRDDAPKKLGRGAPRQIPAILLAKLALSADLHGQGLGAELLVRALGTIIDAARKAGGKVVVVDAVDDGVLSTSRFRGASGSLRPLGDEAQHRGASTWRRVAVKRADLPKFLPKKRSET
jgi:GNAT superfamily N-acetyltransferase